MRLISSNCNRILREWAKLPRKEDLRAKEEEVLARHSPTHKLACLSLKGSLITVEEELLPHRRIGKTAKGKRRVLLKEIIFFIINLALLVQ
jgi:hypothetical protein